MHEATLIDEDFGYLPGAEVKQEVYLKAGLHPIKLNYLMQKGILPSLKLKHQNEKGNWVELSENDFYH